MGELLIKLDRDRDRFFGVGVGAAMVTAKQIVEVGLLIFCKKIYSEPLDRLLFLEDMFLRNTTKIAERDRNKQRILQLLRSSASTKVGQKPK